MRGIHILELSFPQGMENPDQQVKRLTYLALNIRTICPALPVNVKPFVLRGRSAVHGKEIPLLGLHERNALQALGAKAGSSGASSSDWDRGAVDTRLQQWIDGQPVSELIGKIAATDAPTFDDLDDRKK